MSTTETTDTAPVELQKGHIGQSIPRKEDKRLVQGQGVFFDDVRRHGTGYVHFVRSPYAHAKIVSIDVARGARARRRLRDADRRRGRDPDRPVLRDVDAAGERDQGLRARGRQGALHGRAGRRGLRARPASSRATPPSSSRSSTSRSTCSSTRARRSRTRPSCTTTPARTSSGAASSTGATGRRRRPRPTTIVTIDELHFHRFSSTPLECSGALVEYEQRHRPVDAALQPPDARASARSGWRRRCAPGIDKLRFVTQDIGGGFGNKICLHPYYVTLCLLSRKLNRPVQLDRVAHRPAHGERARQRALVPRRRGRGQGRRDDARLQRQGARRLRRLPALRAARLHHLGAGDPGLLRLAEHPRRLHAGDDEQVAGVAEPRLLADAAPLADRADHRHRRRRARARPGRDAQAQLRQDRADAVRDAERLRLRLRRLRALPRHRARPDRLRLDRGAARGGGGAREAARHRDRLDARLRHEQLRPVAAPQPGAPVLGQQRGRDGEARHLRRGRRHARHGAAGPGPRDDGVAGRRRHPRLLARPGARAAGPRHVLQLARRLLGHVREPVRGHRARRRQGRRRRCCGPR